MVHDDVNFLNAVRALALAEECGEAVKAVLDVYLGNGKATPQDIAKKCLQTAAMALRLALDCEHVEKQEKTGD